MRNLCALTVSLAMAALVVAVGCTLEEVTQPKSTPEIREGSGDAGLPVEQDTPSASTSSLREGWDKLKSAQYQNVDKDVSNNLSRALGQEPPPDEFEALVGDACAVLDSTVDRNAVTFEEEARWLDRIDSSSLEGQVALWVYIKSGGEWESYCQWQKDRPTPTTAPTPTPEPTPTPVPFELYICTTECYPESIEAGGKFYVNIDGLPRNGRLFIAPTMPDYPSELICGEHWELRDSGDTKVLAEERGPLPYVIEVNKENGPFGLEFQTCANSAGELRLILVFEDVEEPRQIVTLRVQ